MKKIKVIFKTHLDIGFTDFAEVVTLRYLERDIPRAIETADYFRAHDHNQFRYCWTVGSWLLYEYLERSNSLERKKLEVAVERGDIAWHALPFTTHSELAGESLFRFGLALSQKLDARFGRKTTGAKLTDVPGHTRGIVGPLAEAGVKLLHIGINPASAAAKVPPLFRWRDREGREIIVAYQPDYGSMLEIPGHDTGYLIVVGGDNTGAQSPEVVLELLKQHPGAETATFSDLAAELEPLRETLPLVTSEIGDSWIHGVGSDPWKVARFRELCRFRREEGLEREEQFSRLLLQVAEHTWGMDEKTHFKNRTAWRASELRKIAAEPEMVRFVASWKEQRDYLTRAVAALPAASAEKAQRRLETLNPVPVRLSARRCNCFETKHFVIEIDPERGCLSRLCRKDAGLELAAPDRPLFLFVQESFTVADMERFMSRYLRSRAAWALADFGKPGMPESLPKQVAEGFPARAGGRYRDGAWHIALGGDYPRGRVGGFHRVTLELTLPDDRPQIQARLQWFGKSPDRQPHAAWLEFHPAVKCDFCRFTKLGEPVDASDVVAGGGRSLHAIDGAVRWGNERAVLEVDSPDAPLLAPGRRALGDFPDTLPDPAAGIGFNLYNNLWGTNFPMWFGDDMLFRFELNLPPD